MKLTPLCPGCLAVDSHEQEMDPVMWCGGPHDYRWQCACCGLTARERELVALLGYPIADAFGAWTEQHDGARPQS